MSKNSKNIPPKWADRLLSWYCNPKLLEQIQGDAHELFNWRVEEEGLKKAKRSFVWDVIRLFRWSNIRRTKKQGHKLNQTAMFKNYFKIGLRNLWKQRMPSLINALGLSLAIACCLVAYQFSEKDFIVDKFHENKDRIHLVTPIRLVEGTPWRYAKTKAQIADLIPDNVVGIESITRYYSGYGRVKVRENTFLSSIAFVDPNFFDQFTFPVKLGEENPLKDRSGVVLSESFAKRLFNTEYPIGKALTISLNGIEQEFIVSSVIEDKQHESNLDVKIIVNYQSMPALNELIGDATYVFVTIPENVSVATVSSGMESLISLIPEEDARAYKTINLAPFTSLMDLGTSLIDTFAYGISYNGIMVIGGIALFMLILATFNYINISTAMAMSRVKEIGIRKVIGSNRLQLIFQFLIENFILCSVSLILGLLLATGFFLPWFNLVAGESFFIDVFNNHRIIVFLGGLLFFITVSSGIYPAYVAAKLQPTAIFKDASSLRGKKKLTGVLLTVQLTLALITVVNALMFIYTEQDHRARDWGFERTGRLAISNIPNTDFNVLRNEIEGLAAVESVSGSYGGITYLGGLSKVSYNGRKSPVRITLAEAGYAETIGFRLQKGRFLDADRIEDKNKSIVVNSTFLRYTGIDSLNSKVMIDSSEFIVVGVISDFTNSGFSLRTLPCAIRLGDEQSFDHLTVKVRDGSEEQVMSRIQSVFGTIADNKAILTPMENVMDNFFTESKRTQNLMVFSATITLFLAAMGIFGLVSIKIKHNIKLFGIKKVLGAGMKHLYKDIYKPFLAIFISAFVIGGAASSVLVTPILDMIHSQFPDFNLWVLLIGIIILVAVVVLTINTQVQKLVRLNPVDTLRNE